MRSGAVAPRAMLTRRPPAQEIKVSAKSTTKTVAGALAYLARERRSVRIVAGSAACINTALKASATARRYVEADGVDLYILPRCARAARGAAARGAAC